MSSMCYLCASGHSTVIPGTHAGDAVGVCKTCHILACQGHGVRDVNFPRWICVLCDANLLAVAAIVQTSAAGAQSSLLSDVSDTLIAAAKLIRSVRRYFAGRPSDSWNWVEEQAGSYVERMSLAGDDELQRIWKSLRTENKLMLGSALAMVKKLELPDHGLINLLRRLRARV